MVTVISAVIVLGVLIFVHELGHFLMAKRAGVGVTTFSLGFGPRLLGFEKNGTDYRLSAIPLGGFVRMVGEDPGEEVSPEDISRSFSHKPVGWRFAIVAAGPLSNIAFAFLAYYLVLLVWGLPVLTPRVGNVDPDRPAAAAGVQKGDMVLSINGHEVKIWDDMVELIQANGGNPLDMILERDGRQVEVVVHPQKVTATNIFGEEEEVFQVGILAGPEVKIEEAGPGRSLVLAVEKTYTASKLIVLTVVKLIQAKVSPKSLGGPIFIAQVAGEAASAGMAPLLDFAALISVNLAVLNLLPVPPLDGGHLFFFGVEAVRRKPVSLAIREKFQQFGMVLMLLLMVLVFYNDIARIVTGGGMQ